MPSSPAPSTLAARVNWVSTTPRVRLEGRGGENALGHQRGRVEWERGEDQKPAENIRLVRCAHTTTIILGTIKPSEVDRLLWFN